MSTIATDDFLATLEKSDLLTAEQLADARDMVEESHDATALAKVLIRQDLLTRWQAGQLLAGRSSFFLGKYKLIELLGRGGMGHVFLGEHTTMNRRVALKIVSREVRKDPASLDRFLGEARAIAALDHPNIVQAYSVDNEGDRYYIVMEYVDGIDLQRMVEENGPLDYETAADCIRQAADGLAHGHGRNMIHCDVKPSNLLVNEQGVVKIVDMGLSRLAETDGQKPDGQKPNGQDDSVLGSVDYLAPEQALESPDFDHRADIYALGCTLYFLLTGHPPFPEGSLHERLMKHQTQRPQSIIQQRPDAPADLVELCEKMMAKKAEDRPQSAEEISRTLADWQPPPRKPERRTPLKVAQSLEKPAAAAGLPSIDVNLSVKPEPTKAKPAKAVSAKKKDSAKAGGFLSTPRQKIIAGTVGLLVAAVLAVAAVFMFGGPSTELLQADPTQVEPNDDEKIAHDPDEDKTPEEPNDDDAFPAIGRLPDETLSDEPPAAEPPEVEPENQEPPEVEPENLEPPDDEPPVDKPPVDKPKPEEPKKVDPFGELVGAVELQSLDTAAGAGEPLALGKLHLEPNASWHIELLGGSSALKGKRQFELKRDGDGWLVNIDSQTATQPAAVARIWHDDGKLMFQWLKDAEPDSANCLCNCVLNIQVGRETRPLRLSKTLRADPLEIDFIKRVVTNKVRGRFLPEQSKLRLEITDLQGKFPAYRLEPRQPITTKQRINLFLDRKDRHGNVQPMMCYQIEWAVKGDDLAVTLRLMQPNTKVFNFKLLEDETKLAQARALSEQIEGQLKKERNGQKKMQMEAALNMYAGLLWYAEQYRAIHQKGIIHFRIYTEDGEGSSESQIELVNTQAGGRK